MIKIQKQCFFATQITNHTIIMLQATLDRLNDLCQKVPPMLQAIPEQEFSMKPSAEQWSKKEIIGHLIDSATNNHQRFVRAQFEETPTILYQQNQWNKYNYYQQMDAQQVIAFWAAYNTQLLHLARLMPSEQWEKQCYTDQSHPLSYLITDYVAHLEHHLKQVIDWNTIS